MLKDKIEDLKKEKDVVILAHNYQIPEVQDVADFVGDSLGLARQAAKTPHKTILFCGVHFMAETAAIISPEKKVLIPDVAAGCSLSDSITPEQLKKWKQEHPNAIAVGSTGSDSTATFGPSSTSGETNVLFGHMSAVATASHIAKTEVVRDPNSFADIVRGLHVFGRKVLRPSGSGFIGVYSAVPDLDT